MLKRKLQKIGSAAKDEVRKVLLGAVRDAARDLVQEKTRDLWDAYWDPGYTEVEIDRTRTASKVLGFLCENSHNRDYDRFSAKDVSDVASVGDAEEVIVPTPTPDEKIEFEYEGTPVYVRRNTHKDVGGGDLIEVPNNGVVLLAKAGREFFQRLLADAIEHFDRKEGATVHVNTDGWKQVRRETRFTMENVILEEGLAEELLSDLERFRSRREFYEKHRIPYRRGYLFYGPPGTGKSSIARAFAGETGMNLYELQLSGGELSDQDLRSLFNQTEPDSIILLEDVDRALHGREQTGDSEVTFSGLTNCLDGVSAQEGRVVVMTTNRRDQLDDALTRGGRADVETRIGLATTDQLRRLFLKFYEGHDEKARAFANRLPDQELAPAEVQSHFQDYMDEPQAALTHTTQLEV